MSQIKLNSRVGYPKTKEALEFYEGKVIEEIPTGEVKVVFDLHPQRWIILHPTKLKLLPDVIPT